jgi:glycerol-3-phosphate acyltransferase PlsY
MVWFLAVATILIGYVLGSIPSGAIIVRLATGKDIRNIGSGRTGGTNAMRAGGSLAGAVTGVLDVLKSFLAIAICRWILPGNHFLEALTGLAAVLGHNYSLFLVEWRETKIGKIPIFHGGAGGAPTVGAAAAFWFPSLYIVLPIGLLVFIFIGYASVTTLAGGIAVIIIFSIRAYLGYSSKWYVVFSVITLCLLAWSLRPNIERLLKGTERVVGMRAWIKREKQGVRDGGSSSQG